MSPTFWSDFFCFQESDFLKIESEFKLARIYFRYISFGMDTGDIFGKSY